MLRKIGVFGGTFNPIHKAHIEVAIAAKEQLGLDFVLVMTGGNPPHKESEFIYDGKIRHIMVKKALSGLDTLIPCDYEVNRSEYSYSVDTLKFLKGIYPDDEIYFIIGGDSYASFHKWYKPEEILKLCTLAVYKRNAQADESFFIKNNARVVYVEGKFLDISSTAIREDIEANKSLINKDVLDFISYYKLYKSNNEEEILKSMLSPARYIHSVNVAKMCVELAGKWNVDRKTAHLMGMLHDIAKDIDKTIAIKMCDELNAQVDGIERTMPQLIHPKLGAELVKCYFNIKEGIITSAIRCHTVGKIGMNIYDKILFVADMCEEGRSFEGVEKIREEAFKDLDKAVVMCIDSTIAFTKRRGFFVHPMAYALRKELLSKKIVN